MATQLLNDDGTASMATAIMCSHHAFHRDVARIAAGLAARDTSIDVLREQWTNLRGALHGHHTSEETGIFPDLRAKHPDLAASLDALDAHHRAIDPLLDRGDRAFADLAAQRSGAIADAERGSIASPGSAGVRSEADAERRSIEVITELRALLVEHLAAEELVVIPHLRSAKEFPLPPTDEVVAMYADGFAWALGGIADSVVARICEMLPPAIASKLPAARAAFAEKTRLAWGAPHQGASMTSVPGA